MRLDFTISQSLGDIGDIPLMFHGADNEARIVHRTNNRTWIRECPTPQGVWEDVEIGDPILYERCAGDITCLNLAYESGYNGIYVWDGTGWWDDIREQEMALLLDNKRPTPRFVEMMLRVRDNLETILDDKKSIEVEGKVQ